MKMYGGSEGLFLRFRIVASCKFTAGRITPWGRFLIGCETDWVSHMLT